MRDGKRTTEPDLVLADWQKRSSLVATSLVGRFDSDGRRCRLARQRTARSRDPRGLSPLGRRSRTSHVRLRAETIAYELGLSRLGTVGSVMTRLPEARRSLPAPELIRRLMIPIECGARRGRRLLVFTSPAPAVSAVLGITPAEGDRSRGVPVERDDRTSPLGTSVRTVEEQLGAAMRKLDVRSRARDRGAPSQDARVLTTSAYRVVVRRR